MMLEKAKWNQYVKKVFSLVVTAKQRDLGSSPQTVKCHRNRCFTAGLVYLILLARSKRCSTTITFRKTMVSHQGYGA